jgi:hypothetical protein
MCIAPSSRTAVNQRSLIARLTLAAPSALVIAIFSV